MIHTAAPPETAGARNPVPPLKKEHWEFYTDSFPSLRAPMARLNRFHRRKNSSNGSCSRLPADRLRPDRTKDGNGRTVTTRHVLLPRQRGKAGFLLPIWQPNSDSLGLAGYKKGTRGRGGSAGFIHRKCHIDKLPWKFYAKWRARHHRHKH